MNFLVSWFRSPVKLFAWSGIGLFIARLVFPARDFAGAYNVHTWLQLTDFRLDLNGFGLFECVGPVFLISALAC